MKSLITLLFLASTIQSFGQISWNFKINLQGQAATEEKLPFWMEHNQRGRFADDTNYAGWISGKAVYLSESNSVLEIGAGLLARDGIADNAFVDELYAHYETFSWSLTVGRKQQKELYNGLSASNRNILWSLNARPLPGFQLQTTRPIFLLKNLGFEAEWEEYLMNDERFVNETRLHHKSFHLIYSTKDRNFQFKAGIQHFAQWGGNSPAFGEQPKGIEDYLRIITGRSGAEGATVSDQINVLGNHLGGYEFSAFKGFPQFDLEIFYQHLFEDGSGRRLGNTPDGRYGLFINSTEPNQFISSLMYEFYTTHHQSHTTTGIHKNDDYFNNTGYRSGWTYYNRTLAAPFFTANPEGMGIINNKFTAHHLGIGGNFSSVLGNHPYRLLLSYAQNDGRRHIRYNPKQEVFYALWEFKIMHKRLELKLQFAAEYDNYKAPIYGIGALLVYRLE